MDKSKHKTLVNATNDLNSRGYDNTFKFENGKLICFQNDKPYGPNDIVIEEQYRFEGMTNPSDSSIVFAVKCKDGVKGTVVSAYGPYANADLLQFMDELEINTV
jgi:hypothetical protein